MSKKLYDAWHYDDKLYMRLNRLLNVSDSSWFPYVPNLALLLHLIHFGRVEPEKFSKTAAIWHFQVNLFRLMGSLSKRSRRKTTVHYLLFQPTRTFFVRKTSPMKSNNALWCLTAYYIGWPRLATQDKNAVLWCFITEAWRQSPSKAVLSISWKAQTKPN